MVFIGKRKTVIEIFGKLESAGQGIYGTRLGLCPISRKYARRGDFKVIFELHDGLSRVEVTSIPPANAVIAIEYLKDSRAQGKDFTGPGWAFARYFANKPFDCQVIFDLHDG